MKELTTEQEARKTYLFFKRKLTDDEHRSGYVSNKLLGEKND